MPVQVLVSAPSGTVHWKPFNLSDGVILDITILAHRIKATTDVSLGIKLTFRRVYNDFFNTRDGAILLRFEELYAVGAWGVTPEISIRSSLPELDLTQIISEEKGSNRSVTLGKLVLSSIHVEVSLTSCPS